MSDLPTPEELRETLSKLGDTPEAVAQTLENKGIKGRRKSPESCPITNYLGQQYGRGFFWGTRSLFKDGKRVGVFKPYEVIPRFVVAFDNRKYPNLEGRE